MKSIISIILLSLSLVSTALRAEEVQATVMTVSGKTQFYDASGQGQALKPGTLLRQGTRITTEGSSLAVLLLADGSKLSIGPNTEMTLTELTKDGESFGNVFNLLKGLIRASVQKLTVGSKFEIASTHGVAAVKGTEYEAEVKDDGMEVRVKEGKVWLSDAKREHTEEIARDMKGNCRHDAIEKPHPMRKEEIERFGRWAYDNLPKDTKREREAAIFWNHLRPEQQAKAFGALREALGSTWDDITTLKAEERQERWRERAHRVDDRKLVSDEAQIDFTLGKCMIDRTGRKVRFDEFLIRPSADQIQFLNYTKREDRTDLVNAVNTYNKALPRRLGEARDINLKIWDHDPDFWVVKSTVVFANSANDSFAGGSWYFNPVKILNHWELPIEKVELRLNVPDISKPTVGGLLLEQYTRVTTPYSTNPLQAITAISTVASNTRVDASTGLSFGGNITPAQAVVTDLRWSGGIGFVAGNYYNFTNAPTVRLLTSDELGTGKGDLAWGERRAYSDGTHVDMTSYAIDENGKIRNAADLLSKGLFNAYLDLSFRTYEEVSISSNRFSALGNIDIVSQMMMWFSITKRADTL